MRPAKGIGGELTANPIVRKPTFTGSTEIGKFGGMKESGIGIKGCI